MTAREDAPNGRAPRGGRNGDAYRRQNLVKLVSWYRRAAASTNAPVEGRIAAACVLGNVGSRSDAVPLKILMNSAPKYGLTPEALGDGLAWLKGKDLLFVRANNVILDITVREGPLFDGD